CLSYSDYNNVQILSDLESFNKPKNYVIVEIRSFTKAEDIIEINVKPKNLVEIKSFVDIRDFEEEGVFGKKSVIEIEGLESFVG
ncbi:10765_t:CDS:1, partial [Cetraspora pellucida]